ncbi:MAG: hypothetical protein ACTHMV_15055 [Chitinophagaceae bacterium]
MLKYYSILVLSFCAFYYSSNAQFVYKIKADSVKITNDSCTAELIIENSTKNVQGYLYNKGNGRTEFRPVSGTNGWQLTGNSNVLSASQFLGTTDSNKLVIKTNAIQRASFSGNGTLIFGPNDTASRPLFRFYPNGDFSISGPDRTYSSAPSVKSGIRYHQRLGYLEIGGTRNVIDTTISEIYKTSSTTSALIINNDDVNYINGQLKSAIIAAYGVQLGTNKIISHSSLFGGSAYINDTIYHSIMVGNYNFIYKKLNNSIISGNVQRAYENDYNSNWSGYNNRNSAWTNSCIIGGRDNNMGSVAQLTVGNRLINRSFAATVIGNGNVDFSSLPYNSFADFNTFSIEPNYLLFSIGNSQSKTATTRSNAMTVLYNGRTQINTTGFSDSISQAGATPKAALEVVSKSSGVLLPKLTKNQRDSIASQDLHNGLLLYNTDAGGFEYYNGSAWKAIGSNSDAIQVLKDSTIINWDFSLGHNKSVKLTGNRTLNITNVQNGAEGKIIIKQDSTGMRKLALPANSYVNNEGNGSLDLTSVAGGIDIASFIYDGTNYYWTIHKSYTSAPKVARFNFNETAQNVPGWNDVSGNPHQAIRTAKDVATNIGVSSIATTKWGAFGSGTSNNVLGEKDANPSFVFGAQVTSSYWFSATYTYSTSADCNLEINGLEAGATYNIEILASRENADVTDPNRYMRVVCVDNAGTSYVEDFDAKGNTANLINFYNKAPNGSGKILLFIGKKNPADASNPFGYLNGLRITKL